MKILFCREEFSQGLPWQGLAPYFPGHELVSCDRDHILENLDGVDILVPSYANIGRDIIERGTFGLIHQFGVGLEKVDVEAATENGVWVTRIPSADSGNAETVSELAVFFMLALARRIVGTQETMRTGYQNGVWGYPAGLGLYKKTACVVGLGDIGLAIARRLAPFDMRLTAVRQHPAKPLPAGVRIDAMYGADQLNLALADADFVIISVNYGKESHHMFNADAFAHMKRGTFVVNIARGGLIDENALVDALASGQVAGAGLDVFWEEPVDYNHPLFRYNVIGTPHVGGITDSFYEGGARIIADNIDRYVHGQAPLYAVNHPEHPRQVAVTK